MAIQRRYPIKISQDTLRYFELVMLRWHATGSFSLWNRSLRVLSRSCCGNSKQWEAVIGIEVHAQLRTKHKLLSHTSIDFSDPGLNEVPEASNQQVGEYFRFEAAQQSHSNAPPNTMVGFCEAGLPGALPSLYLVSMYFVLIVC